MLTAYYRGGKTARWKEGAGILSATDYKGGRHVVVTDVRERERSDMSLRHGSTFSGIGGFDLGFDLAGMETLWQIESDKWCRGVLNRQWPDADLHGDIEEVDVDALAGCQIISGGVPCQGFSVAGRGEGLDDDRSGLFTEFARVLRGVRPRWFVFENVPGLLSSNGGRDMGAVLGVLGDLGYTCVWRVLDSQHFGVPQRRRRLFIVGHLGEVCPPEVLLEPEGMCRDSPPSEEEREEPAGPPPSGSWHESAAGGLAFQASDYSDYKYEQADRSRPITTSADRSRAAPIAVSRPDQNPIAFGTKRDASDAMWDLSPTLRSMNFEGSHINAGGQVGVVQQNGSDIQANRDIGTVRPGMAKQTSGPVLVFPALRGSGHGWQGQHNDDMARAGLPLEDGAIPRRLTPKECERLQGFPDKWTAYGNWHGLEDDPPNTAPGISDTRRYRMLGNAVTMPVAAWIGRRIIALEQGVDLLAHVREDA